MKQLHDNAIVLTRRDFGEADRIVTFLTMQNGKLTGLVKGARKSRSKMAAGIELLSKVQIGFLDSPRELKTITSAQLVAHYSTITKHVERVLWSYEMLKLLDRSTEQEFDASYYQLAVDTIEALNNIHITLPTIQAWFYSHLLHLRGVSINTRFQASGKQLLNNAQYIFVIEDMAFTLHPEGTFSAAHIKLLRLIASNQPHKLTTIQGIDAMSQVLASELKKAATYHLSSK